MKTLGGLRCSDVDLLTMIVLLTINEVSTAMVRHFGTIPQKMIKTWPAPSAAVDAYRRDHWYSQETSTTTATGTSRSEHLRAGDGKR